MKERIEHILRAKNMTAAEFAEKLGIQASGLSHILSGRNNPSLDFVMKLKTAFPEYNFDWLLLGVGPMTSYEQPIQTVNPVTVQPSLFADQEEVEELKEKDVVAQPKESTEDDSPKTVSSPSENADNELEMIILVYSDGSFERIRPRR